MISFQDKLNYLGGKLSISKGIDRYIDLEEFFVECSIHFETDNRTKQTILNWLYEYGVLLSPSKIRRILKCSRYDKRNIDVIVHFLLSLKRVHTNWKILASNKNVKVPKFIPNPTKYLKNKKFVLNKASEIRFRAEGRSQVVADILSYSLKENFQSLYMLAKEINSPRNRVNEEFKKLVQFQILD